MPGLTNTSSSYCNCRANCLGHISPSSHCSCLNRVADKDNENCFYPHRQEHP